MNFNKLKRNLFYISRHRLFIILLFLVFIQIVLLWLLFNFYDQVNFYFVIFIVIFFSGIFYFFIKKNITLLKKNLISNSHSSRFGEFEPINELFTKINKSFIYRQKIISSENETLMNTLNLIEDGIIFLDIDMKISNFNKKSKEILMCSIENENINYLTDLTQSFEIIDFFAKSKTSNSNEINIEFNFPKKYLKIRLFTLNKLQNKFMLIISDLSDAYNLDKTRSEFFANTSHEFKTPITSAKLNYEAMINDFKTSKGENFHLFSKNIFEDLNRLEKITNELLNIHSLETGNYKLKLEEIDFLDMFYEVKKTFSTIIKDKKITIVHPEDKIKIKLDKKLIIQSLENLLSNAIRYSKKQSNVNINYYIKNNQFIFEIRDHGIGISEFDLPLIFQRFFRAEGNRDYEHSGLGLSIVKHAIELHKGEIKAESVVNEGLLISFSIPL